MARVTAKSRRFDPYKNFKFRVLWGSANLPVAGFSKAGSLGVSSAQLKNRKSGLPSLEHGIPGRAKYEAVTLERGVTHDAEFAAWANTVAACASDASAIPPTSALRDVLIEMRNETGETMRCYNLYRCWVSEFQALASVDASANEIFVEHLTLEHEARRRHRSPTN